MFAGKAIFSMLPTTFGNRSSTRIPDDPLSPGVRPGLRRGIIEQTKSMDRRAGRSAYQNDPNWRDLAPSEHLHADDGMNGRDRLRRLAPRERYIANLGNLLAGDRGGAQRQLTAALR